MPMLTNFFTVALEDHYAEQYKGDRQFGRTFSLFAAVGNILALLTKDFLRPILISFLIANPVRSLGSE